MGYLAQGQQRHFFRHISSAAGKLTASHKKDRRKHDLSTRWQGRNFKTRGRLDYLYSRTDFNACLPDGLSGKSTEKRDGINAVMQDFSHVMIDMIRFNTGFLRTFWENSPVPDFNHGSNITFWIIYILIFVGLALQASGARMWRQSRHLREGIEDQLILENAKGPEGRSRQQLEERIVVPRHTIFLQIFPLYVLPIIIVVAGYFLLKLLGFITP